MKLLRSTFTLLLICAAWATQAQELTTFVIMRHAEKVLDGTSDPMLTEKGLARAERLSDLLVSQDISAIYSTPYQRNLLTVSPVAKAKNLDVTEYDPRDKEFLSNVFRSQKGNIIVVVGHSNTINALVNELIGEARFEARSEDDYNDLFIVTIAEIGKGTVTHLNY